MKYLYIIVFNALFFVNSYTDSQTVLPGNENRIICTKIYS